MLCVFLPEGLSISATITSRSVFCTHSTRTNNSTCMMLSSRPGLDPIWVCQGGGAVPGEGWFVSWEVCFQPGFLILDLPECSLTFW